MTTDATDDASKPSEMPRGLKKGSKCFHSIAYIERYVSEDTPAFWERLDDVYSIFEAYQKHYNRAAWARCCYTFERLHHVGALEHPEAQTINIKDLIAQEGIYSQGEFRLFMLKTLPRNKDGHILMPQINMRHIVIKQEEPEQSEHRPDTPRIKKEEASQSMMKEEDGSEDQSHHLKRLTEEITALREENASLQVS